MNFIFHKFESQQNELRFELQGKSGEEEQGQKILQSLYDGLLIFNMILKPNPNNQYSVSHCDSPEKFFQCSNVFYLVCGLTYLNWIKLTKVQLPAIEEENLSTQESLVMQRPRP